MKQMVFVLALMAIIRMLAWWIGDYTVWLGDLPRSEASAFLLIAIALVWLRPTVSECVAAATAVVVSRPERDERK